MSWQEYLIPGTNLVDYGPAMDGFSPTYKHVMPGCSQGNTVSSNDITCSFVCLLPQRIFACEGLDAARLC